jgi:hypothetical protein
VVLQLWEELEMSNAQGCQCGQAHATCTTEFQYAVKTICGEANTETPNAPVAPGQYWTAINIHNPDKCKDAHFRFKIAIAFQGSSNPISQYIGPIPLGPDAALEIDCPIIRGLVSLLYPPKFMPTFIKGFFVIESDIELDVVAVYTAAQNAKGPVSTFQTERVQGRCVPVCEDLVLPLHTGIAAWQTVSPAPVGPVVAVNPTPPIPGIWAFPTFGSQWVSQSSTDGGVASLITRSYQLCFDLCSGFEVPAQFQIQVQADDSAIVYLNGTQTGTVPFPGFATPLPVPVTVNTSLLKAGNNCFRVDVTNGPLPEGFGATGFAVAGILRVARGKCPCAPLPLVAPSQGRGADAKEAASLFDQIAAASKAN